MNLSTMEAITTVRISVPDPQQTYQGVSLPAITDRGQIIFEDEVLSTTEAITTVEPKQRFLICNRPIKECHFPQSPIRIRSSVNDQATHFGRQKKNFARRAAFPPAWPPIRFFKLMKILNREGAQEAALLFLKKYLRETKETEKRKILKNKKA